MPEKPSYEELEKRILDLEQAEFRHRRTCEALKESEERFKALSEATFEAIFLSEKGICLDQNQAAERMFGYTRAEAVGRQGTEWIALEDRAQAKKKMLTGYEEPYEVTALRKNGTSFPCEIVGRKINYRGQAIRITALRDITERKQAEQELVKSEERYRRIFENLQDVYYESGLDGTILEVSPSIEKISLYKRGDLIGKSLYDIYTNPKERDEFVALILDTGMVNDYEINLKDKDGSQRACSITTLLIRDSQGTPIKLIGSMRDISERKQAEEELRLSEKRYGTLLGAIPDPVIVYDPKGSATYLNDAFVKFYGWSREELIGRRPDFVPPGEIEATQRSWRSTLKDGTAIFETKRWNKNGDLLDIQIRTAILRDQEGKHVSTIVIHRDVTELKQAEVALRAARDELEARVERRTLELARANEELCAKIAESQQAEEEIRELNETLEKRVAERTAEMEKRTCQLQQVALDLTNAEDRELKRFAAILHDDFQQEAAYIKMELDRLSQQADTDMRPQIAQLGRVLGGFIEKMRHLSYALNPPALHRSGLLAALEVLAKDLQKHHRLAVTLHAEPGAEPDSHALASMLYRSVRELLFNVIKHAGVNAADVAVRSQGERIRIQVTDEGRGFYYPAIIGDQGGDQGFGLYNIEDRMMFLGGSMQVTAKPGQGCCIVLTVPRNTARRADALDGLTRTALEQNSTAPEPTGVAASPENKDEIRILLVDDHKMIRKALAQLLQGHTELSIVGEALNGREAIKLAARLKPHVILMDVAMPELDGVETTVHITRKHPDIRVIGLSMHSDDDTRQKMLSAGAVAFLAKTDSPDILLKTIRRVHQGSRNMERKAGIRH